MIVKNNNEKFFVLNVGGFINEWQNSSGGLKQFDFFNVLSYMNYVSSLRVNDNNKYFDYDNNFIKLKSPSLVSIQGLLKLKSILTTNAVYLGKENYPYLTKVDINNTSFTNFYFNFCMHLDKNESISLISNNISDRIIIQNHTQCWFNVVGQYLF